jgi:hypothetical protein
MAASVQRQADLIFRNDAAASPRTGLQCRFRNGSQKRGTVSFVDAIFRRTATFLTKASDFGIKLGMGVCVREWVTCQAIPNDVASTPSGAGP